MRELLDELNDPYLIAVLAGVAVSFVVLFFISKKSPVSRVQLFFAIVTALVGLFIGAHLMFLIVKLPGIIANTQTDPITSVDDLLNRLFYGASGMVFYGGLFGSIGGIAVFCKGHHLKLRSYMNVLAVVFPLFHCFGRIGCSLSGCCYGIEYYGPFALHYTAANITPGINDDIADYPRFPVQPMESLIGLILFVVMLIIYLKTQDKYPLICIYMSCYCLVRFFDEFLRADEVRGIWGPFSTSQWISIGLFIFLVIYWVWWSVKAAKGHSVSQTLPM